MNPKCCAPFAQLSVHPNGKIFPCCYNQGYAVGSSQNVSLEEVWNGSKMQKLRRDLLQDEPKICKSRMFHLECQKTFEHLRSSTDREIIQTKPPIRLDVRLNGYCNLRCVMCDVWEMPSGKYNDSWFWRDSQEKVFPSLKEIEILGGEPFLQDDTFRLVETIFAVNPKCKFGFVTNGHYNSNGRILDALQKIELLYLQLSLDSAHAENYARIRRDGDLRVVLKSLEHFLRLREEKYFEFRCSMTVLRQNIFEIREFLEFCEERSLSPILQIAFHDPSGESALKYADAMELERACNYLGSLPKKFAPTVEPVHRYAAFVMKREILRVYTQDDKPRRHPEQSEGSPANTRAALPPQ